MTDGASKIYGYTGLIERYIDRIITESSPQAPLWNIESLRSGKKPHWNYIDGCMMSALYRIYEQTRDNKYLAFITKFFDYYIKEDGGILGYKLTDYNIDNISGGRVLFDLYKLTGNEKYRAAIETLYSQLQSQPRNRYGSFWHKLIYPDQVWLDGLYMGQVFYTRYETEFNHCKNYSDIILQFENARKYMFDENKRLYYHGFDASKKAFWADAAGRSKSFWLRSTGWYMVAIADILEYIPPGAGQYAEYLSELLKEALSGVLEYQDAASGMLYQVVDRAEEDGNYLETSGSAMIAYAVIKAAKLGVLERRYLDTGRGIFHGICKKYLREEAGELHLGGICLVAGLGPEDNRRRDGTYSYYVSEPVVEDDAKGLGAFIMAYSELRGVPR